MKLPKISSANVLQGAQLAAAVVLSYGASAALHLPENFWAVMSALIVVRPSADATLHAGRERVFGTLAGSLAGLFGAWMLHHGHADTIGALAIVAVLAFATAGRPSLRSAPIAALIILSGAVMAGHSATGVALARMAEIGVGVVAGFVVAWVSRHIGATPNLSHACAELLRVLATQVREPAATNAGTRSREAVRHVGMLVHKSRNPKDTAMLSACLRVAQDASVVSRLVKSGAPGAAERAQDIALRLDAAAAALESGTPFEATPNATEWPKEAPLSVDPVRWLQRDLADLMRSCAH